MADRWAQFRSSRFFALTWLAPLILVGLFLIVVAAKAIRAQPDVQAFLGTYPGESELPDGAPVGFPAWLQWQHFLNAFFILLIIRTGWQIRTVKRAAAYWTRNNTGILKTKNPPVRVGLHVWLHFSLDALWILNGAAFYILLFATGHWVRVIPTNWDVAPNALSTALQYASLEWPTENGWINYNALQLLAYFTTVFIAAPLAIITGIRMAPGFAGFFRRFEKVYPITVARAIHFPVMIYFVVFTIVHVMLVLTTGALRNLNHMYAGRDDQTWWGFGIFALSIIVMVAAWIAARPSILASIASLTGTVRR